ncbi:MULTISPECIES: ATP-binding protein [unclassified Streptomyces]|uniref:ATP-binding protein n=1 Tax=unclassified Streptomyces TaxID=2593676 RepID=UPI0036E2724D
MTEGIHPISDVGAPRFVGRGPELSRLTAALARPPALVLVEGEAGIGKSRLLREALASRTVRHLTVLVAACPPFREALTLGPVVDAARRARHGIAGLELSALAGALRPLFPEWAAELPPVPEPLVDAGAARHRLIRALAELLERMRIDVLVVEDVHWADDATLDFLLFLISRQPPGISLVLTYRPEDVPAGSLLLRLSSRPPTGVGHARIGLAPLSVPDCADLVSSMLDGDPVSEAFSSFLHERTEGVPLALEESVRLLRDRADIVRRDGEWVRHALTEIAVPPTIRDAVSERVARLDADARLVLQAAAVLTEPAAESVLVSVSGLAVRRARVAVDEALGSGLLGQDETGRTAFRHVLAARAVYDSVGVRDRRELHRRAGQALEGDALPPAGRLAHHFRAAGDDEKWARYAEDAADLAIATGDHDTAVALLHELIDEAGLPARSVVRLTKKIPFLALDGYARRKDLLHTLRAMAEEDGLTARERAGLRDQLGRLLIHLGEFAPGVVELERAIPDLADDPVSVARTMTVLGVPASSLRPASEHRRWLARAAALVSRSVPERERLPFLVDHCNALLGLGDGKGWDLAARLPASAQSPTDALHLTRAALNTGNAAMAWGLYDDARRRLTRALELAERHTFLGLRGLIRATLVHLDWFSGSWTGLAERAAELAELDAEPLVRLDALLVSCLIGSATGTRPDREGAIRLVHDEGVRRGIVDMPLEPAAALARERLAQGAVQEALDLTEGPIDVVLRKGIWLWGTEIAPVRVAALVAAGRSDEGQRLVASFGRGLRGRDVPAATASLLTCRALLAQERQRPGVAADAWQRAAAAWRVLPRPYAALLADERRARCLLSADGEREAALVRLTQVLRGFSDLGARTDADRVVHTLNEHGVAARSVWRGGRRGYGNQLSPRETEVVRLLLGGLTNKEIAQELSRSPKTVAAQLNSAMRKHGVSSRTALAVSVARAGITPKDPSGT